MIERILENWLINSSEKTFQIPFCYMLANEGYTIVHLTRHCGMEHGKDVIAIDPEGNVCAYQLKDSKGGKIKLKYYQEELLGQIMQLVHTPVSHPSVPFPNQHLSFFVTNGELEEEVFREIDAFNKNWAFRGQPQYQLKTILKGELLQKALNMKSDMVPADLKDFKLLIDFHLNDGRGTLNKDDFSKLLNDHFSKVPNGNSEAKRIISSGAVLCSVATANFTNNDNYIPLIEAWTIFISQLLCFCESNELEDRLIRNELAIAEEIIVNSLEGLVEEVESREHYLVESYPEDAFLYEFRVTWLVGFVCYLKLYYKLKKDVSNLLVGKVDRIVEATHGKMKIWGESGFPALLMLYWYKKLSGDLDASLVLKDSIDLILLSKDEGYVPLTSPYNDIDDSIASTFSDLAAKKVDVLKKESFYLWPMILLLVDESEREYLESKWESISRLFFKHFQVRNAVDLLKWRCDKGEEVTSTPNAPESWGRLEGVVRSSTNDVLPNTLVGREWLYPLLLLVFPHRVSEQLVLKIHKLLVID